MEKQQLKEIRDDIVSRGKRGPKFKKLARGKEGAKYEDPDNLEESGSITLEDCEVLYALVKGEDPKVIFEIGTWFGVSAAIMRKAAPGAQIYTCDFHNVCILEDDTINRMKMPSNFALKKLQKRGVKIDFVFADGQVLDGDARRLVKMGVKTFITHDYEKGKKGERNIHTMGKVFKGKFFTTKTTIAGIFK